MSKKPETVYRQVALDLYPEVSISTQNLKDPAILKDFPFDKVYDVARKEASRKKPIFWVHRYFARRVTCNFRLALLSLLFPAHEDVWAQFYETHTLPLDDDIVILDPFMGGGTIVFEALRIGAQVVASDLQPLSWLVTYAEVANAPTRAIEDSIAYLEKEVGQTIKGFYKTTCPECGKQADIMYCFWVKHSRCLSSTSNRCEGVDLYHSYRLATRKGTHTLVCPECRKVFNTRSLKQEVNCPSCGARIASPKTGVVQLGKFHCQRCGESAYVRELNEPSEEPLPLRMIAQEYFCPHCEARGYKSVSDEDLDLYEFATLEFERKRELLPIPWQKIPDGYNTRQMINHGYTYFYQMFNKRQLLCLGELLAAIDECPIEQARVWLLTAFSAALEMNNLFCRYQYNAWKICNIFFNHAYVPITMPVENNVWGAKLGTGTFTKAVGKLLRAKKFSHKIYDVAVIGGKSTKVQSQDTVVTEPVRRWEALDRNSPWLTTMDARSLSQIYSNSVDIVLTDPPYSGNVMYSELIDFFHVWLHQSKTGRRIGFSEPYSPKTEEIVVNLGHDKSFDDYAEGLTEAFEEIARVLKDDGYLVFTFHDNTLSGWLAVLQAIQTAGFRIQCTYPIHAESRTGAHTSNKESIAFDLVLVCTKRTESSEQSSQEQIVDFRDLENKAFKRAEQQAKRLEEVSAELTMRDLENICLASLFVVLDETGTLSRIPMAQLEERSKMLIDHIEGRLGDIDLVDKRTGWWSQLYGSNAGP